MPTMTNEFLTVEAAPQIIATGVSFEEYLEVYAGMHCELVRGNVIKMSPASFRHNAVIGYLHMLLVAYFSLRPIGQVIPQPFTQRLPNVEPKREPDLLVLLNTNLARLKPTYLDGPADICVEVLSPGSEDTDRGAKFSEYEKGGVGEYWLFDPLRKEARFHRRNEDGLLIAERIEAGSHYRTPTLPGFALHVPTLWQDPLADFYAIGEAVKAMLS
jgi:Uma2 family endonuclease